VIVGEADDLWPRFIEDFRRGSPDGSTGRTPAVSERASRPAYSCWIPARYLTLRRKGCEGSCRRPSFRCRPPAGARTTATIAPVTSFSGHRYRARPWRRGRARSGRSTPRMPVRRRQHLRQPLAGQGAVHRAVPLKIAWVGQGTLDAADDAGLLGARARKRLRSRSSSAWRGISAGTLNGSGSGSTAWTGTLRRFRRFREAGIAADGQHDVRPRRANRNGLRRDRPFLVRHRVPYALWQPLNAAARNDAARTVPGGRALKTIGGGRPRAGRRLPAPEVHRLPVAEERFHRDVPAGVRAFYSPGNILLRDALAAAGAVRHEDGPQPDLPRPRRRAGVDHGELSEAGRRPACERRRAGTR